MKRSIIFLSIILFCICTNVNANIICNDGTKSETCMDCHQGCCSGHDGCLKEKENDNNDYLKYFGIGAGVVGTSGIVGGAAYAGSRAGAKSNKKN